LRRRLGYRNPKFYYIAAVINLILRFFWVLSISPGIVSMFAEPEIFTTFIASAEAYRRV
jgi:hypothetical protein